MPRKRKKPKQAQQRETVNERDRMSAKVWSRLIKRALELKQDYVNKAEEVEAFLSGDHSKLYDDPRTEHYFMSFKGSSVVSVPKVAQVRAALGPRLYPAKPRRRITATSTDGVSLGLARTLEAYLNYSAKEARFVRQARRSIDDGLIRGRCVLQQVYDPIREIVTSIHLSSLDLVYDPDFEDIEDAKWVAYRVREPLWEVERRLGRGNRRIKGLREKLATVKEDSVVTDEDSRAEDFVPETTPTLTYWVVLSKMGWGGRCLGAGAHKFPDEEDFVRLEIVVDHQCPIAEGQWEVPFYLDRDWPISIKDYIEPLGTVWPDSVFGQVLSVQKAVDLLTSLKLTGCKNRDRIVVLGDERLKKMNHETLRNGSSADYIPVTVPAGQTIESMVKVMEFGDGSVDTSMERDFHLRQIEQVTGVTDIMHGGEATTAKDRSATATNVRAEAASTRTNDLKQRTEELFTDAARKEAIIARLTITAEEIDRLVTADDIDLYYVSVKVPGGVEIPIRDTRPVEEKEAGDMTGPLTMEQLSPGASNYFLTAEDAVNAMVYLWQDMQMSQEPRVMELTSILGSQLAEEDMLPVGMRVAAVTAKRVWLDTAGMSPQDIMRELDFQIASGSGVKLDQVAEQQHAENMIQTALPAALQAGDIGMANTLLERVDDAYDVPEEDRTKFSPPPAPMPGQGQGPPQQGGKR